MDDSLVDAKQARLKAIERQIERLQRRLHFLDARSNRLGWTRVGIFFGGALLSVGFYVSVFPRRPDPADACCHGDAALSTAPAAATTATETPSLALARRNRRAWRFRRGSPVVCTWSAFYGSDAYVCCPANGATNTCRNTQTYRQGDEPTNIAASPDERSGDFRQ